MKKYRTSSSISACFGAFLTLHPTKYADLLKEKLEKHDTNVYLVNTGWSQKFHIWIGERMSIKTTLSMYKCFISEKYKIQKKFKIIILDL